MTNYGSMHGFRRLMASCIAGAALALLAPAARAGDDELAKKLSNPVANLISVPFQFNADFGSGADDDGEKYYLNLQPVIPFSINEKYNVIVRTIVPVIYQDDVVVDGSSSQFGLGDTVQSFFLSPKDPVGGWILGAGPVFLWPTGTNDSLGSGKWGAGPTGVALRQEGPWTFGVLANHIWSYAGDGDRNEVNATFVQPFLTYTTKTATSFILNTESTYDWTHDDWTIPINGTIGQIVKVGKLPVQIFVGARYYAAAPEGGPEWGLRGGFTLLFPK